MKIKPEYLTIPIEQLVPDARNANVCLPDLLAKLRTNMARSGACPALIARPDPTDEKRKIIIDGHHRWAVAKSLQWSHVPCELWHVDETEAQLLLVTLNRLRGEDNPRKRAELLNGLTLQFGADELVKLIPETRDQLDDLLALLKLQDEELQANVAKLLAAQQNELPVILSFTLKRAEADLVQTTLTKYQPKGDKNPSSGLIALCTTMTTQKEEGNG
jgi:ParB-like chromosome segregation protein Spo0J